MMEISLPFREIWAVDFEFKADPGDRPIPICLVAKELRSGRIIRQWENEFGAKPPYSIGHDSLFIAYYASAEFGCHRALGWPDPIHILDLYVEFHDHTSGLTVPAGRGLLGALIYHHLDHIGADEKTDMRELAMRGGPWTEDEKTRLLAYCQTDVDALERLLPAMLPYIDLPHALLRGAYMAAAAAIEWTGVPIDVSTLEKLRKHWEHIQSQLIVTTPIARDLYDGNTFKRDRFIAFLASHDLRWPYLETGQIDLEDDTFAEMSDIHPIIRPIYDVRHAMAQLRLSSLAVGKDGRNRTLLCAFQAKTGRNQPSNAKFIFGPAKWMRGLIKPEPGTGIAYLDWEQQEFGIAAALSDDPAMRAAYESGDPYLEFAKQAGAVPPEATKESHKSVREQFKACVLAVQYGMGHRSLALRIGQFPIVARKLLRAHHDTFPVFWDWSDRVFNHACLEGSIHTRFNWHVHVDANTRSRSLLNFPMQGNGAEMLRLACCFAVKAGVEICAPVHDAVLIGAPVQELEAAVAKTAMAMTKASRVILNGFELRVEAKTVRWPNRYMDERGAETWGRIMGLLDEIERLAAE
jgi:DNA polymerase-1